MGSRTSAETLNPLPPDPARHQLSAIPPFSPSWAPKGMLDKVGEGGWKGRVKGPGVSPRLKESGDEMYLFHHVGRDLSLLSRLRGRSLQDDRGSPTGLQDA